MRVARWAGGLIKGSEAVTPFMPAGQLRAPEGWTPTAMLSSLKAKDGD